MSSSNTKNNKDHCIKFKLGIYKVFLKIGKILFILGFFLLQLGKKHAFGFGNDTRNRSLFYSEKNH